jgi:hypothetical protein
MKDKILYINLNVILIYLVMRFPIYCNFKSETEKSIHTISGITVNFLKPGLVKEALGKLVDLTPG